MHPSQPSARARRVLVTGGAGFIGSHLCERLAARGDRVTVVDNLSTGSADNLADARRIGDIAFIRDDLSRALADLGGEAFDEIYHLAAAVGVRLVLERPIESIETNVNETAALLRFACSAGEGGKPARVLIASSSEVYGKGIRSPFREDDDVVYGPTTMTRWSYACSKALDEHLAISHHRAHGLPVVIARFFNTVGPRQVGEYGMVLPRFVRAALEGRDLEVFGDGSQSRCFCDVRDVAGVLPTMLGAPGCAGGVFNVGSARAISIVELARLVISVTGSRSGVRLVPYATAYPPGFEDLGVRVPDLSRIRSVVGFEPSVPLERTIADVAATLGGVVRSAAGAEASR